MLLATMTEAMSLEFFVEVDVSALHCFIRERAKPVNTAKLSPWQTVGLRVDAAQPMVPARLFTWTITAPLKVRQPVRCLQEIFFLL